MNGTGPGPGQQGTQQPAASSDDLLGISAPPAGGGPGQGATQGPTTDDLLGIAPKGPSLYDSWIAPAVRSFAHGAASLPAQTLQTLGEAADPAAAIAKFLAGKPPEGVPADAVPKTPAETMQPAVDKAQSFADTVVHPVDENGLPQIDHPKLRHYFLEASDAAGSIAAGQMMGGLLGKVGKWLQIGKDPAEVVSRLNTAIKADEDGAKAIYQSHPDMNRVVAGPETQKFLGTPGGEKAYAAVRDAEAEWGRQLPQNPMIPMPASAPGSAPLYVLGTDVRTMHSMSKYLRNIAEQRFGAGGIDPTSAAEMVKKLEPAMAEARQAAPAFAQAQGQWAEAQSLKAARDVATGGIPASAEVDALVKAGQLSPELQQAASHAASGGMPTSPREFLRATIGAGTHPFERLRASIGERVGGEPANKLTDDVTNRMALAAHGAGAGAGEAALADILRSAPSAKVARLMGFSPRAAAVPMSTVLQRASYQVPAVALQKLLGNALQPNGSEQNP